MKVQKGIPLQRRKGGRWVELIEEMDLGDSVLLEKGEATGFAQSVYHNHKKYTVATRKQPDGQYRCWLIKRTQGARG